MGYALRIVGACACPTLSDPVDIFRALAIEKERTREREIRTALIGYSLLVVKEQGGTFQDVIKHLDPQADDRTNTADVERARQERLLLSLRQHAINRGLGYVDNR